MQENYFLNQKCKVGAMRILPLARLAKTVGKIMYEGYELNRAAEGLYKSPSLMVVVEFL